MGNTLLALENLNVSYKTKRFTFRKDLYAGQEVVKNISFSINAGETYGIIGESGCGKTTMAKAISGLIKYSGSIKINAVELSRLSNKVRSSKIQMIFQNPYNSLNPSMSIKDILEEPLKIHNLCNKLERTHKVAKMLHLIGLDAGYSNRYICEMSGGQRQRISIGCALMLQPQLIVADEVLSALDVSVQANILNIFRELNEDFGVTFLFISHDINVVAYFCNSIAVMYAGEIVETGNAVEIYNNPIHPYTKILIQAVPHIDKKVYDFVFTKNDNNSLASCSCAFAKICPKYCEKCLNKSIDLIDIAPNHKVKCVNI